MPTITRVTATPVRVPVPRELIHDPEFIYEPLNRGPSGAYDGEWVGDVPFYVVEVACDGGPSGWGDIPRGQDPAALREALQQLIGLEATEISPRTRLFGSMYLRGVQSAALDLRARIAGVPLHALVGEQLREGAFVDRWTGMRTPAGAAEQALAAQEAGFKGLKLKANEVTDGPGIVAAIRAACGDDFRVTIDPNARWQSTDVVIPRAAAMAAAGANAWLEDPLSATAETLAQVRRQSGVQLVVTVPQYAAIEQVLAAAAADGLNFGGGWPELLQQGELAAQHRVPFWVGCGLQSGLDALATIHYSVTQPMAQLGADFTANFLRLDDLILEPVEICDGVAKCPDGPGLGIAVDLDAVARYRIGDPIVAA